MNEKKPYKLDKLSQYVGNDESQIKEMITIFLDTIPPDIAMLQEMADKKEWQGAYEVAHRIKPSFDVFEMDEMLNEIRRIEKIASENNVEGNLADYVKGLSKKFDKIILLLQAEFEK